MSLSLVGVDVSLYVQLLPPLNWPSLWFPWAEYALERIRLSSGVVATENGLIVSWGTAKIMAIVAFMAAAYAVYMLLGCVISMCRPRQRRTGVIFISKTALKGCEMATKEQHLRNAQAGIELEPTYHTSVLCRSLYADQFAAMRACKHCKLQADHRIV